MQGPSNPVSMALRPCFQPTCEPQDFRPVLVIDPCRRTVQQTGPTGDNFSSSQSTEERPFPSNLEEIGARTGDISWRQMFSSSRSEKPDADTLPQRSTPLAGSRYREIAPIELPRRGGVVEAQLRLNRMWSHFELIQEQYSEPILRTNGNL